MTGLRPAADAFAADGPGRDAMVMAVETRLAAAPGL